MRCAPFAAHAHTDTRLHAETVIPTCMRSRFIDCKHPVAASTDHVFPTPPWGFFPRAARCFQRKVMAMASDALKAQTPSLTGTAATSPHGYP